MAKQWGRYVRQASSSLSFRFNRQGQLPWWSGGTQRSTVHLRHTPRLSSHSRPYPKRGKHYQQAEGRGIWTFQFGIPNGLHSVGTRLATVSGDAPYFRSTRPHKWTASGRLSLLQMITAISSFVGAAVILSEAIIVSSSPIFNHRQQSCHSDTGRCIEPKLRWPPSYTNASSSDLAPGSEGADSSSNLFHYSETPPIVMSC